MFTYLILVKNIEPVQGSHEDQHPHLSGTGTYAIRLHTDIRTQY